ncbi:cell division protein FtsK [Campylobacter sp. MIT 12-5580]|uniref:DNA translocase FtsK n=1 Tax=Campylobacter sp. MIT 12-5580 TaxID=2040651 RepID=UPI0010F9D738|nr:DNA translocase FtsK [Campylobacter sp. MIT 12-5580]TKX28816.1 cell division protein FtsK [Campylobacter sp. MIT 12-5580]
MPDSLGFISRILGEFNLFLFGDFALFYPFVLLPLNFIFYKRKYEFDNILRRESIGLFLAFFGCVLLFGILSKEAGYIPEVLYTIIGALFGRVLSGILALLMLLLALILLFPAFIEAVFGVRIDFSVFASYEEKLKHILYRFFGGKNEKEKEQTKENIQEELVKEFTQDETFKEKDFNTQEAESVQLEKEDLQGLEAEVFIQRDLQDKDINEQEPQQIEDSKQEESNLSEALDEPAFSTQNKQIHNFVTKASAQSFEFEDSNPLEMKKEAFVPERFLKPKKLEEIKMNLAYKSNFDEPSYKRKNINLKEEITSPEQEETTQEPNLTEQIQSAKTEQESDQPFSFEVNELEVKEKPKEPKEQEFIPIVEEYQPKENSQEVLASQSLQSLNSAQNQEQTQHTKAYIQTELKSNTALLDSLEKGKLEAPKDFKLPSLEFLVNPSQNKIEINEQEIDKKIYDLLEKLRRFKIGGDVISTYTGPVVTTFEFRPSADVKVSRILNLQDDLAMALKASSIRIQAPIPGKDVVGIEVPNEQIQTIYLREILESEIFKNAKSPLTLALGKDIVGNAFITDLKKLPHLLIAGTTGSGKSVGINSMLLSLLYRNSPKTLKLMMIDPKMLEFSIYNDIPHLLTPVITDPKKAVNALSNMVAEMERRYKLMAEAKTKNIENYNDKMKELKKQGLEANEELPFIVVIIDELADLMMTAGKDVEFYIARLAQMARASGIHLIVATQRPSVDVVTGLIKANLPSRLAYKVGQKVDSKVILDTQGAESLLGRGDGLFTPPGTSNLVRIHAPYASEMEIEKIVDFLKAQQAVEYDENFLKDNSSSQAVSMSGESSAGTKDELFEQAKAVILEDRKTSISYLQRRLNIGYNRAANIIEQLSDEGILSQPNAKGQREIL